MFGAGLMLRVDSLAAALGYILNKIHPQQPISNKNIHLFYFHV